MQDVQSRLSLFGFGAFGGILPTLANLGTTFVTVPETPMPAIGMLFGLLMFAVVGGGVALTNTTPEMRQAIFAGIAAPAILMSIIAGASDSGNRRRTAIFISEAIAQPSQMTTGKAPTGTLYVSPTVSGGSDIRDSIPVTAQVRRGSQVETITIGNIKQLDAPTAFAVPAGVDQVFVMGNPVQITGPVTQAYVDVRTRPTAAGDFWWALGGQRKFAVEDLKVIPQK